MTDLRFVIDHDPGKMVEYPLRSDQHVPRVGEGVVADGSDPLFPAGIYETTHVTSHVTMRGGTRLVVVDVRTVRSGDQLAHHGQGSS